MVKSTRDIKDWVIGTRIDDEGKVSCPHCGAGPESMYWAPEHFWACSKCGYNPAYDYDERDYDVREE
jgi:ribosomal protein L37AE/L43A